MLFLWREEEELQKLRGGHVSAAAQVDVVGYLCDDVYHLLVFLELQTFLREVAEAHRLADVKLSAVRFHLAQQHLDEGGLSCSVITHDAHLFEACKVVIEVAQNDFLLAAVVEGLADILAFENLRADVNGRSFQPYLSVLNALFCHFLKLVKGILSVFRLMSTGLWLTAHPFQLPAIKVLRVLNLSPKVVHALLSFLQIVGVVAAIGIDALIVELQYHVAHLVEEESVVGHHKDGLVAPVQIAFQPFYHFQVEMVGRLVEHQEVGLGYQHVGKRHTLLLSTAQLSHGLLQVGDVQLCEYLSRLEHLLGIVLVVETGIEYTLLGIKLGRLFQKAQFQVTSVDDRS